MSENYKLLIGANPEGEKVFLNSSMSNRHGLITGATGTGKTITLQVLAEAFSSIGVPVFSADVKGDLSGISESGTLNPKIEERIKKINIQDYQNKSFPTIFWDLYGKNGHFVRTSIDKVEPVLLSRLLGSNDTQEGVLQIAFKLAEEKNVPIIDLKDLKSLLQWMGDHQNEIKLDYGNVSKSSIGAILRDILTLEEVGADEFFAEPVINIKHFMQKDFSGKGVISILDSSKLITNSKLYSTFLLWLLTELFLQLDEVGDLDKPKLVFFFDEAHLLFKDTPKILLSKIETLVKLIRSKGVGVFFVTQNPADIPDPVLAQLGNKIQHALRAYTPNERKAIKAAANSFRPNPNFDTETLITELGIGESLVSVLDEEGKPTIVERVLNAPPHSQIGPITPEKRKEVITNSPVESFYGEKQERRSAFEIISEWRDKEDVEKPKKKKRQGIIETFFKSITRTIGSYIGRYIVKGILKNILKK